VGDARLGGVSGEIRTHEQDGIGSHAPPARLCVRHHSTRLSGFSGTLTNDEARTGAGLLGTAPPALCGALLLWPERPASISWSGLYLQIHVERKMRHCARSGASCFPLHFVAQPVGQIPL
jgi:hypothetical protein